MEKGEHETHKNRVALLWGISIAARAVSQQSQKCVPPWLYRLLVHTTPDSSGDTLVGQAGGQGPQAVAAVGQVVVQVLDRALAGHNRLQGGGEEVLGFQ